MSEINPSRWRLARVAGILLLFCLIVFVSASCGQPTPTANAPSPQPLPSESAVPAPTATLPGMAVVDTGVPVPPQVVSQQPAPGQELPLDGSLEIQFDQPMDQAATTAAWQMLGPEGEAVAGEVTWLNERTLRFTASEPLQSGQMYVAGLSGDALSAEGLPVDQAMRWEFATVGALEVQQVFPADGATEVANNAVITVIFNRPVVPLVIAEDQSALPSPLQITPPLAGKGEWVNTSVYAYYPDGALHGDTEYTVAVAAGLQDMSGEAVLEEEVSWSFTPPPRISPVIGW